MANYSSRRFFLPLLCALIAGGVWAYYTTFVSHRLESPAVDSDPFQSVWTERKVLLVGIGDNLVDGLGATSKAHSFFNRLLKNPSDEIEEMKGKIFDAGAAKDYVIEPLNS